MAESERDGSEVVQTLVQLFGIAAGFVGLVYAAGAGVLALRLYLAHLPSRTIVGQLPRDLLISVGLAQVVLPVLAVVALYAAYRLLRGATPPPKTLVRQWTERTSWRSWAELVGGSAIPALVVAAIIALGAESVEAGSKQLLWLDPVEKLSLVAFLVTVLTVLVALNMRARLVERYGSSETRWSARRPIAWMTLLVALASVPVCVMLSGSFFPLLDAKVCTSQSEIRGVLIGETSDRVYVGETKPTPRAGTDRAKRETALVVFSVPSSRVTETFIGGSASTHDCPVAATPSG